MPTGWLPEVPQGSAYDSSDVRSLRVLIGVIRSGRGRRIQTGNGRRRSADDGTRLGGPVRRRPADSGRSGTADRHQPIRHRPIRRGPGNGTCGSDPASSGPPGSTGPAADSDEPSGRNSWSSRSVRGRSPSVQPEADGSGRRTRSGSAASTQPRDLVQSDSATATAARSGWASLGPVPFGPVVVGVPRPESRWPVRWPGLRWPLIPLTRPRPTPAPAAWAPDGIRSAAAGAVESVSRHWRGKKRRPRPGRRRDELRLGGCRRSHRRRRGRAQLGRSCGRRECTGRACADRDRAGRDRTGRRDCNARDSADRDSTGRDCTARRQRRPVPRQREPHSRGVGHRQLKRPTGLAGHVVPTSAAWAWRSAAAPRPPQR